MSGGTAGAAASDCDERLWDAVEQQRARRLLQAALACFAERGYHATTTRQIADRAGTSPTAMYVYYRSKMDLLVLLSEIGHGAVLEEVGAALGPATGAADGVRRFVHAFVSWHARNHTLARVLQYEIHAIPPDRFDAVRSLRRQTELRLRELLREGTEAGQFAIDDLKLAAVSILSLGIDVARWYDGEPEPEVLGAAQASLVTRMIAAAPARPVDVD